MVTRDLRFPSLLSQEGTELGSFRVNRLVFLKNTKLVSLGVHSNYLYIVAKGHIGPCYRTTSISTANLVQ